MSKRKGYLEDIGSNFGRKVRRMIHESRRGGEVRTIETPLTLEQEQQQAQERAEAVEQRNQKGEGK